ncbi:hypothetical protein CPC08DRAFT_651250 [Agrocybe pediades]|nr:hypothetical protein CPC08DRAFT_651250 [Agrocybe pediades]
MLSDFSNDKAHISTKWMHQLVISQGLVIDYVLHIRYKSTGSSHYLMILSDKRYICDCCMGVSLGIPCRHYFQAWTTFKGLPFSLGLIRARWYQDSSLNVSKIKAVTQTHDILPADSPFKNLHTTVISNPLAVDQVQSPPPPATQTIGSREVFQTVQSSIKPFLSNIQTQEELEHFLSRLADLR